MRCHGLRGLYPFPALGRSGIALILLGAGALGFAAGLVRSAAVDRGLVAEVEQHIDELRERDLREVEKRWRTEGVSPVEQAWSALQRSHDPETDTASELDAQLGRMIQARCDRVWDGIRDRRYVKQEHGKIGGLDGRAVFEEIRSVVEEVARLYGKDAEKAELDARIGDIALAARSAIGDLLQVARQVPVVNVTGLTVREVVTRLEQVQKVRNLYRKYTPYQHYVRGATLAARIALGANPVTLAASTVGSEALTRVGKHVAKRYVEGWMKELLEGSVALVYLQVARTYDPATRIGALTGSGSSRRFGFTSWFRASTTTASSCWTAFCARRFRTSSPSWRCCAHLPTTMSRTPR